MTNKRLQSIAMPAALIGAAFFAISPKTNFPRYSGERRSGATARAAAAGEQEKYDHPSRKHGLPPSAGSEELEHVVPGSAKRSSPGCGAMAASPCASPPPASG